MTCVMAVANNIKNGQIVGNLADRWDDDIDGGGKSGVGMACLDGGRCGDVGLVWHWWLGLCGFSDGYAVSNIDGFTDGFTYVFTRGFTDGFTDGLTDGFTVGLAFKGCGF